MTTGPRRHALYGLTIEAPFALPGAPPSDATGAPADIHIECEIGDGWDASRARVVHAAPDAQRPSFAECADGSVVLAWGAQLAFVVAPARDRILVVARPDLLAYAPTVLVGFVLGCVLHLRGVSCLHGAVVTVGGRAISLLGASGAGKSTLTAALVLRGAALLSDDLTVLRRDGAVVLAEPGCAALRLSPTSAARLLGADAALPRVPWIDKRLWEPERGRVATAAAPLDALYVLDARDGDGPLSVGAPLAPPDALRWLVASWYPPEHLHLLGRARLDALGALAAELPVRVIRGARAWDRLPRLVDLLVA